jgi:hypothetical protein
MLAMAFLVAACGGSASKSSTAAPASGHSASGQSANSLAKFCSDDANEVDLENQVGDDPDPSDPATHALIVKAVKNLKVEVSEAPRSIESDLQTLENDTATVAAGKTPQGESNYNEYNDAIDAINNWTGANCPDTSSTDNNTGSNDAAANDNSNGFNSINNQSDNSGGSSDQSTATDG